jgi:hypothetical protein
MEGLPRPDALVTQQRHVNNDVGDLLNRGWAEPQPNAWPLLVFMRGLVGFKFTGKRWINSDH